MAITGTGTEQDPFIVHSYSEIVEAVASHPATGSTPYYSRLVNDIDCNSYGVDWEWETIELSSNRSGLSHCDILDLYGHTIKNVFVKDGNMLFGGTSVSSYPAGVINGNIINVFGSTPNKACENVILNNVSISLEFSSVGGYVFNNCIITNCAIYAIILHQNSNSSALIYYTGQGTNIKNVDIYVEIYNCLNGTAILHSTSSNAYTDSVRIIGKLVPADPTNPTKPVLATYKTLNSVIDVDMSAFSFIAGGGTKDIVKGDAKNTTVINTDTIDFDGYTIPNSYLRATSSQMKVGSELRGLGFLVVNVEE